MMSSCAPFSIATTANGGDTGLTGELVISQRASCERYERQLSNTQQAARYKVVLTPFRSLRVLPLVTNDGENSYRDPLAKRYEQAARAMVPRNPWR
jgi:hypothetical protein